MWNRFPSTILYEGMRRQQELNLEQLECVDWEHRQILAALTRHDPAEAEEAIRRHIRNLFQQLAEVLGIPLDKLKELLA